MLLYLIFLMIMKIGIKITQITNTQNLKFFQIKIKKILHIYKMIISLKTLERKNLNLNLLKLKII